ncbi:ankyrin repeat domain-containing protein [Flavobacterium sp.]|uniref:ankyrin repeat domain-containing protein n=1 Tax=Flavobacterium sp. TaxID=239 RepID=UPI00120443FB|nr:ankyrin repeat domain-containing protein [Flavobacterium sp.]RZJ72859.1 MAG: ankyrin repeat domain-containing protein [Flavobacterium sp.]
MPKKRKTLPKDFESLLENSSVEELIRLFDSVEIEARGGYSKQTALGFEKCPHELAKWLIENGCGMESANEYGYTPLQQRSMRYHSNIKSLLELGADIHVNNRHGTPLHCAIQNHNAENVKMLIEFGANTDLESAYGYGKDNLYTPLELNLVSCRNIDIQNTLEISKILLNAGANNTYRTKGFVLEIGKTFEFYRSKFNDESVDETSAALHELYRLFDVEPVATRVLYDGKSQISVDSKTWQKQHQELWELLVPGSGSANTVQGEVIRITGKIARELLDNGAVNWDSDYKKMTNAFVQYVQRGKALATSELDKVKIVAVEVNARNDENVYTLSELAVKWVLLNPDPIALDAVGYDR